MRDPQLSHMYIYAARKIQAFTAHVAAEWKEAVEMVPSSIQADEELILEHGSQGRMPSLGCNVKTFSAKIERI